VLKNLDSVIARMRGLKRKLSACADEEQRLHRKAERRVEHLGELYGMQSLDDPRYEGWSQTRLNRLLVDYMCREGYTESAGSLAKEQNIEELTDVSTFVQAKKIRDSLRNGSVTEALAWCAENKKELKKMDVRPPPSCSTVLHFTD
jgi:macrophage erythroblast attacher